MKIKMLFTTFILLIILSVGTGCTDKNTGTDKGSGGTGNTVSEENVKVEVGKAAPTFELKSLDGEDVKLESFRGKLVLLNFWASWCRPCTSEMPIIEKLAKENGDIVIIGINASEDLDKVKSFVQENKYDHIKFVMDSDMAVADKYMVQGIPTSVFIDKDGVVKKILVGSRDEVTFKKEIENIK